MVLHLAFILGVSGLRGKVRQKGLWRKIIDIDHKYFKIYPLPDLQRRKLFSFPASQNRILKICQPFHP
jgi:hypothetical protein